ncbi:MAG: hypothetical protein AAFY27_02715 [Pseudomonadota bacterium]
MSEALRFRDPAHGTFLPRDEFLQVSRGRPVQLFFADERDVQGPLVNATLYFGLAALFLILVVDHLWNDRFLIATVFFLAVAAMAFTDSVTANRVRYFRVDTVDASTRVSYATPSLDEAQDVCRRVAAASVAPASGRTRTHVQLAHLNSNAA